MTTFVLTGTQPPPQFQRHAFVMVTLQWKSADVKAANAFVDSVIGGQTRFLSVPTAQQGIIATELDFAGVVWHHQ